jgi:glycosyltransferase involved in cell wall biosynthesis
MAKVTVVIPAYNEVDAIGDTVRSVRTAFDDSDHTFEIIVVDDGSHDGTDGEAELAGARVIRHPLNIGYGNALMTGIRGARYPIVAITDADGTYPVHELPALVAELEKRKLDMLVGSRGGQHYRQGLVKSIARSIFKFLAEFTCGRSIPDINSGFRVMRRDMVLQAANVLCGGFSFTTTLTVVAMLTNHFVDYRPIAYHQRIGKSHVRYFRDTLRSLQILLMTILVFNPIKLYLLFAIIASAAGVVVGSSCVVLPQYFGPLLLGSLFFLVACLLMAFGFLADQRRAIAQAQRMIVDPLTRRLDEDGIGAGEENEFAAR